jgi:Predicted membrane protein (DUF2207)
MRSTSIIRAAIFILSFGLSILLGTTAIQATAADPFYWEKMDVDLQLAESGDLLVTETQKYVFTDKYTNRRNRYIQIDKIDSIQDIIVTENNKPVSNLQISKSDGKQHISWEHTFTEKFPEEHTFVLKYRAIGSLEVDDPQTKFKWMAIFPDRKVPVNTAQVTLHLPAKLAEATKEFTTNGVAVDIKKIDPTTIQFVAKGSIEPQSKLAILGQFSTNLLTVKKSQWQASSNFIGWLLFAVYLIIFCLLLTYTRRKLYQEAAWIVMIVFLSPIPFFMLPWWASLLLLFGAVIYFPFAGGGGWGRGGRGGGGCGGDGGGGGCGGGCGGCGGGG